MNTYGPGVNYPITPREVDGVLLPVGKDNGLIATVYESYPPESADPITVEEALERCIARPEIGYYVSRVGNHVTRIGYDDIVSALFHGHTYRLWSEKWLDRTFGTEKSRYKRVGPSGNLYIGVQSLITVRYPTSTYTPGTTPA